LKTSPSNTLLEWLTREFPRGKKQTFKRMLSDQRIMINDHAATRLSQALGEKDIVRVRSRVDQTPQHRVSLHPLRLVHEDEDILVVEKPAGLLTSTVARERRPTALAIVRNYVAAGDARAPVGLIHRLDRDASGLLVFSKSHRAYQSLKTQFFKHTVERAYEALVEGIPNPRAGRIESRLIERGDGSVRSTDVHAQGQRAITDYETVEVLKHSTAGKKAVPTTRLLVRLLTGRKHQIRVHLSERGHTIVGDKVYGSQTPGPLQLRAIRLAIDHPATGKRMTFDITKKSID
jgi:23S rRNA pseudouridine1911/1915/1917 synthase